VKEEGFLLSEENLDEVMKGPQEVHRQEIIKCWLKAGRPPCRVLGPMGNVLQFREAADLVRFLYFLPRLWEYQSPGAFGGSDSSRQKTDMKIFRGGQMIAAEVRREGKLEVRYVLFKTKVDRSHTLMI
jgi:hypothetical protein